MTSLLLFSKISKLVKTRQNWLRQKKTGKTGSRTLQGDINWFVLMPR